MTIFNIRIKLAFTVVRQFQYQGVDADDAIANAKLDEQYKMLATLTGAKWTAEPI